MFKQFVGLSFPRVRDELISMGECPTSEACDGSLLVGELYENHWWFEFDENGFCEEVWFESVED